MDITGIGCEGVDIRKGPLAMSFTNNKEPCGPINFRECIGRVSDSQLLGTESVPYSDLFSKVENYHR
jgi:hypothetical protein